MRNFPALRWKAVPHCAFRLPCNSPGWVESFMYKSRCLLNVYPTSVFYAAIINYHKFGGFKQHKRIILQFCWSEIQAGSISPVGRLCSFLEDPGENWFSVSVGVLVDFDALWLSPPRGHLLPILAFHPRQMVSCHIWVKTKVHTKEVTMLSPDIQRHRAGFLWSRSF